MAKPYFQVGLRASEMRRRIAIRQCFELTVWS